MCIRDRFQTAPHAFDGVVLAVIGRVVGQLYRQAEVVSEVGESGHKLGTSALILRAIVGIDEQGFYLWKANGNCGPEIFDAVYDEIAGHTGGRQIEIEFTLVRQIDAKGSHFLFWFEVMVGRIDDDSCLALA